MPERDNLQFQRDAVAKPKGQQGKYGRSHRVHAGDHIGVEPITRSYVSVIDFAIGTGRMTSPIEFLQRTSSQSSPEGLPSVRNRGVSGKRRLRGAKHGHDSLREAGAPG